MENDKLFERPIIKHALDTLEEMSHDLSRYPRLAGYEHEFRELTNYLHGIAATHSADDMFSPTTLECMSNLVDEASSMPSPVRTWVSFAVLCYLSEEAVYFTDVRSTRPLTEEEKRFGKERLLTLLTRLKSLVAESK